VRTIERSFDDLCTWYIGNHERGAHVIDSQKRYEFVCKALSCVIEMQGLLLQELQILNNRTANGYIRMPGGRSIRGEVRRGD
jgi:hypothetical protein